MARSHSRTAASITQSSTWTAQENLTNHDKLADHDLSYGYDLWHRGFWLKVLLLHWAITPLWAVLAISRIDPRRKVTLSHRLRRREEAQMRIVTQQGTINIGTDSVTVPFRGPGNIASVFGKGRVIPFTEISSVAVGGNDKKYMTGKRGAGTVLTGGLALLAPTRVRGALVIGITGGEVLEYRLKGRDAKRPAAIAMAFSANGVEVS